MPLWTKPSGLYRHRRGPGLYKVGYRERNLHIGMPSLPSTPRKVPSGHRWESSVLHLHCPSVRPTYHSPEARGPPNPGLPQYPRNQASMTRCPARKLSSALQGGSLLRILTVFGRNERVRICNTNITHTAVESIIFHESHPLTTFFAR